MTAMHQQLNLGQTYGFVTKPTIFMGDEMMVENGELVLLRDPDIAALAEKYGARL